VKQGGNGLGVIATVTVTPTVTPGGYCNCHRYPVTPLPQKIGVVETAADFLKQRAGKARPEDMLAFFDKAKRAVPLVGDEV
jgi:hypothetical protein